jgi:hypothetical protein
MKPEPVEAPSLPEFIPAPVDIARLDRRADGGGEHEPVLTPGFSQCQALRFLPLLVLAQVPDRQPGQDNGPPRRACLGLHHPELVVRVLDALSSDHPPAVRHHDGVHLL